MDDIEWIGDLSDFNDIEKTNKDNNLICVNHDNSIDINHDNSKGQTLKIFIHVLLAIIFILLFDGSLIIYTNWYLR